MECWYSSPAVDPAALPTGLSSIIPIFHIITLKVFLRMKIEVKVVSIFMAVALVSVTSFAQEPGKRVSPVAFKTSDSALQSVVDLADFLAKENIAQFGKYRVMVEGAAYKNVWLETQPMGGYMYGRRDPEIARNNIEIFMDHQRVDGRLPGMVSVKDGKLVSHYGWFQGFCFAEPALETWYLLGKDKAFGDKLYTSLEKFDGYLWKTRDSDGDGCLETWCVWDTGEDGCVRFGKAPCEWPLETPPSLEVVLKTLNKKDLENPESEQFLLPIESMDVMSYSYACRDVLARLSKALGNGKEADWRQKAEAVQKALKNRLWDSQKHACYDRDRDNKTMDVLFQGNIKCMYMGSFDQEMADAFIQHNLMNKQVFWTPFPLPSIAANDKLFRNKAGNDWSGQPQGLTWQRSISALENYGHTAELTLLGRIFLANLAKHKKFTQQYDPYTGEPNKSANGYGPSLLAALEFISRMYGIHVTEDKIWWSCLDTPDTVEYSQQLNDAKTRMATAGNTVNCYVNERKVLSFSKGVRVVTDKQGQFLAAVGIETDPKQVKMEFDGKSYEAEIYPNTTLGFAGTLQEVKRVSFCRPRGGLK
jgi:Trehalase